MWARPCNADYSKAPAGSFPLKSSSTLAPSASRQAWPAPAWPSSWQVHCRSRWHPVMIDTARVVHVPGCRQFHVVHVVLAPGKTAITPGKKNTACRHRDTRQGRTPFTRGRETGQKFIRFYPVIRRSPPVCAGRRPPPITPPPPHTHPDKGAFGRRKVYPVFIRLSGQNSMF